LPCPMSVVEVHWDVKGDPQSSGDCFGPIFLVSLCLGVPKPVFPLDKILSVIRSEKIAILDDYFRAPVCSI
jgi:hypothetical protein